MVGSRIGARYYDTNNAIQELTYTQGSSERFVDALAGFDALLDELVAAHPVGSVRSEPSGIPTPSSVLKVTKWLGESGIWHWVETPIDGLTEPDWTELHNARVAAAQTEYPPAS